MFASFLPDPAVDDLVTTDEQNATLRRILQGLGSEVDYDAESHNSLHPLSLDAPSQFDIEIETTNPRNEESIMSPPPSKRARRTKESSPATSRHSESPNSHQTPQSQTPALLTNPTHSALSARLSAARAVRIVDSFNLF
eukprot:c19254_g1_i2.p1 GENE.c19254_g1_i2~~c19254_g1_i2.p1  ORF type:complete len:150 (+),score=19.34 c19254_g1_i2:36-452(+)